MTRLFRFSAPLSTLFRAIVMLAIARRYVTSALLSTARAHPGDMRAVGQASHRRSQRRKATRNPWNRSTLPPPETGDVPVLFSPRNRFENNGWRLLVPLTTNASHAAAVFPAARRTALAGWYRAQTWIVLWLLSILLHKSVSRSRNAACSVRVLCHKAFSSSGEGLTVTFAFRVQ